MTTTQRRFALLSGASLSALGVSVLTATPALAAPHNQVIDGIYGGTDTTSDIIPICAIADDPADCFFGEPFGTSIGAAIGVCADCADIYEMLGRIAGRHQLFR